VPGPPSLFLHVGLPKSGTSFLQTLLADNRDALRNAGFVYPFVRPDGMFHAAVELRRLHKRWGLAPELIDGTWDRMLTRVREFGGTGLVSSELLAVAERRALDRIARDTADLDVHVVVTARDLGRQAAAHWQEEVKNGRWWTFETFQRRVFGRAGSKDPAGFWAYQDLPAVLRRWSRVVAEENVHVVVVPPPGADRWELWRRFASAVGIDPTSLDLGVQPIANESLGAAQVALLRRVNVALDDRLGQPYYAHVVKRFFAQRLLATVPGARAEIPADLCARLDEVVLAWVEEIEGRAWSVHGDLAELRPAPPSDEARHPDAVTAEEMMEGLPDVLAEMLLEIAELRSKIDGPKGLPPLGPSGEPGR